MMEDLKPCPLCQGEASLGKTKYAPSMVKEQGWDQDTFYYINCVRCGTRNGGFVGNITPEKAAEKWNTRPIEDTLRAEHAEKLARKLWQRVLVHRERTKQAVSGLKWTTEPPKVIGWYFWKSDTFNGHGYTNTIYVNDVQELVEGLMRSPHKNIMFAGPISEPQGCYTKDDLRVEMER